MPRISELPDASSANRTDRIPAAQSGTTRYITPAEIFATLTLADIPAGGATSGQVLKWNGSAWAPAAETGGSGDPWEVGAVNNPASPYTLATVTGNAVTRITGLTGNLTIAKPGGTATSGERVFRVVEITASGGNRTITWGASISLGIGVAPSLVVPSGATVRYVLYTDDGWSTATYDGDFATATETARGLVEIATAAEINTGTDAARAVAPDQLAASYAGTKAVSLPLTAAPTDDQATGDGAAWFGVPAAMAGMNLVSARVIQTTAGTTNASTYQVRRVRAGTPVDMLSSALSVASAALTGGGTVNTSNDDVATDDLIYVDIDTLSTTAPKGGAMVLEFRIP